MSTAVAMDEARADARRGWFPPALRQPLALVGASIAVLWLLVAVFAPLVAPYDPLETDFLAMLREHPAATGV